MSQPTREVFRHTTAFARVIGPFLAAVTVIIAAIESGAGETLANPGLLLGARMRLWITSAAQRADLPA
jgi:hypothetical protein